MVPARFCIALVVALAVGADAALPAFTIGTWEMVNPDANSDWAETYTQNADGTFTGYGSWTDAGQAYTYTYYGAFTVQDCNKNTDGTMSTVNTFWWVESGYNPTAPGMMRMTCVYITWSGSDASMKRKGSFRSAEVPVGTPLGECPLLPPHLVADIPFMEVYGEVTRLDQLTYKCVADCEPQPWDCDAASTEDGGSSGGGADAASAGLIAGVVVGVAALAAIAFGAYWFMRAKGGAAEPPMVEVQEMAPAPVPRKDQLYAAAVPVASAPPTMPPPPEPAQERPSMLSRLASWRAPAAEAPTGRNFCTACGAPVQGPFCGGCGLRAA